MSATVADPDVAAASRGLGDVLRTFLIDVLVCPRCSGTRKVLAAIHDPASIARVLAALGLDSAAPERRCREAGR